MNFKIVHETLYQFTANVFLEPHYIRLLPKSTPHHTLTFFELTISPKPAGVSHQIDVEGNLIHFCWFDGMTEKLTIRSEANVLAEKYDPFNFILYPTDFLTWPFSYAEVQQTLLKPSLDFEPLSNPLIEYGKKILEESKLDTVQFVTNLTRQIHLDFVIEVRDVGAPHTPDLAFALKRGSCRDLAWMEINLLRYLGIAARFVSGYFYFPMESGSEYELHAWLEVFLPGAGWIGFDPSHGMVAGSTHIPIVSSSRFENTMPVTGTTRGTGSSNLVTKVMIEEGV